MLGAAYRPHPSGPAEFLGYLCTPAFYLKLVNGAYPTELSKKLVLKDIIDKNPRIVRRIDSHFKSNGNGTGRFSHYRPAAYLQREKGTLLGQLDDPTVERAQQMFTVLNGLLS